MRSKSTKVRVDDFAAKVGRALRRSRLAARKTARMHGTPIYVWRDGKVVAENQDLYYDIQALNDETPMLLQEFQTLLDAYRRPVPLLDVGRALAPHVTAMMDVSDGLLIDASRLAEASGISLEIDLDRVPLSPALIEHLGDDRDARLRAAVAGDDYALLFTASGTSEVRLLGICEPFRVRLTRIGSAASGAGLTLCDRDGTVPLPGRLGYEHGTDG